MTKADPMSRAASPTPSVEDGGPFYARTVGRPPSFDRDAVVAAVEHEFRRSGYAGASIDAIAEAAGLGRGSLYAAFGSKEKLFYDVLDSYCSNLEDTVAQGMAGDDETAVQRLRVFTIRNASLAVTDSDGLGCMAGRFAVEVSRDNDAAGERIITCFKRQQTTLAETVEAAQRAGHMDGDAVPCDVARLMMVTARGMDVLANGGSTPEELEAAAELSVLGLPLTSSGRAALKT